MKITLLGKAKGWEQANRANSYPGEVWGVNTHCLKRLFNKIFDMHTLAVTKNWLTPKEFKRYIEVLEQRHIPCFRPKYVVEIPTSRRFPLEKMPFIYFTSSFDYMIAYAIYYGATELQLYGCKVIKGGSHEYARPNIEFWLGYAMAKGIKIQIHPPSDLLQMQDNKLYGYNTTPEEQIRPEAPAM